MDHQYDKMPVCLLDRNQYKSNVVGRLSFNVTAMQQMMVFKMSDPLNLEPRVLNIQADWDTDAGVWVVTSDDIPGLVTEAATQEEVRTKLLTMIPELFALNAFPDDSAPTELLIHSEQRVALSR